MYRLPRLYLSKTVHPYDGHVAENQKTFSDSDGLDCAGGAPEEE